MYTGIAGSCKQQGWIQELPENCIPQLHMQCISNLLALENSKADYRNYKTSVDKLDTQCIQELLASVNSRAEYQILYTAIACSMYEGLLAFARSNAEYMNYQTPVYCNCILNVCRNCLHL